MAGMLGPIVSGLMLRSRLVAFKLYVADEVSRLSGALWTVTMTVVCRC